MFLEDASILLLKLRFECLNIIERLPAFEDKKLILHLIILEFQSLNLGLESVNFLGLKIKILLYQGKFS